MTWDVIDLGRGLPHDAGMNLTTFLIADSVLLDIAGVAALVEGETELGLALLAVAVVAFVTGLLRKRERSFA
jgi:hypothetical protein